MDPNFYDEVFLEHSCWIVVEDPASGLYKQCVHFLLQKGRSLMWRTCYSGLTSVVTLLLDSGADVNLENVSKFTLHPQYIDKSVSKSLRLTFFSTLKIYVMSFC